MTLALTIVGDELWKRIGESLDRVQFRLRKTLSILEASRIPFAVVGGNAVRIGLAQVDPAAVRATNNVDVLILNSFRLKDRGHIIDPIHVGIIDVSRLVKFPRPLAERLKTLLDNPDQEARVCYPTDRAGMCRCSPRSVCLSLPT